MTSEAAATSTGRSQDFSERQIELNGWPVRLTSYRVGEKYVCQADNVSPGACLARFSAPTQEEAEAQAISKARHLLGKTKRRDV
jgi:hypothetical protein